jgi:arginase family enzyme
MPARMRHALLMATGDPVALRGDHSLTLSIGRAIPHHRDA